MFLTPFDFIIKHRPRKTNPADGLSRIPNSKQAIVGEELTTPIQDRIVGDQTPDLGGTGGIEALTIQSIVGTKNLDADYKHDSEEHDSRTSYKLGQKTAQRDLRSSAYTGPIARRIGTETDKWSKWRELYDELEIPFDVTDTTTTAIQSISTDTIDTLK
jgi:hypothetical protein